MTDPATNADPDPVNDAVNADATDPVADALDPADMREQYRTTELSVSDLAPEPIAQFSRWFKETAENPAIHEPNAMIVATATPDGRPSSRTVLLKHYDAAGFVFFTNYSSRKGEELAANPQISLLFPWHPLARQVIVTGRAVRTGRDETVAYFRTRPHGSQLGAWASHQSSVIASREELLARYEELWRSRIDRLDALLAEPATAPEASTDDPDSTDKTDTQGV